MIHQKTLFSSQAEKQAMLDALALPLPGHAPRTHRTVKRLIWAIETSPVDSRAAWLLSARMETSERHYHRTLELAIGLGLVTRQAVPGDVSLLRVEWSAIERLVRSQPVGQPAVAKARPQTEMSPLTLKCHPCQNNVTPDIIMSGVTFRDAVPESAVSSRPSTGLGKSENGHAVCVAHAGAMNVCMDDMNVSIHSFHSSEPGPQAHEAEATTGKPATSKPPGALPSGLGPGGWCEEITAKTLRSIVDVERLFQFARSRGWVEEADRLGFFALACAIQRASPRAVKNPGAAFTQRVKVRDWSPAAAHDWENARKAQEFLNARNGQKVGSDVGD